jgi:hypothetical protein
MSEPLSGTPVGSLFYADMDALLSAAVKTLWLALLQVIWWVLLLLSILLFIICPIVLSLVIARAVWRSGFTKFSFVLLVLLANVSTAAAQETGEQVGVFTGFFFVYSLGVVLIVFILLGLVIGAVMWLTRFTRMLLVVWRQWTHRAPWLQHALLDIEQDQGTLLVPAGPHPNNVPPIDPRNLADLRFPPIILQAGGFGNIDQLGSIGLPWREAIQTAKVQHNPVFNDTPVMRETVRRSIVHNLMNWGVRPSQIAPMIEVATELAFAPTQAEIEAVVLGMHPMIAERSQYLDQPWPGWLRWWPSRTRVARAAHSHGI